MRRNEGRTYKYLKKILGPDVTITKQFCVHEKIFDRGELVRNYILIDFEFKLGKQQCFVEFDGRQHFEPIKRFGGVSGFKQRVIRDNFLKQYCLEHGIKLISIDGRRYVREKIEKYLITQLKKP